MADLKPAKPWWMPHPVRLHPGWWIAIAIALLAVEYSTGFYSQAPVAYVIPTCLAAWYSGRWPAITLALSIPVAHFAFTLVQHPEVNVLTAVGMMVFRATVVSFMALWFARLSEHERALYSEVEMLKGLLPICSFCKSIRNDEGEWERLELYISRRSKTTFTHGVCPICQEVQYAIIDAATSDHGQVKDHLEQTG